MPRNSVFTLTYRPQISMDVEQQNSFRKSQFRVEVLVNLKTTSCQQPLYNDVVANG